VKAVLEIFAAYILTMLIVKSHALHSFRVWFIKLTPMLFKGEPPTHLINCRLCTGFWVSLVIAGIYGDITLFPLIYGASYFIATQER
jgi:hypothetical protein